MSQQNTDDQVVLTQSQLADRWQVSEVTIRRWRKEGKIRALIIGESVRFRLKDILEFEEASVK
jgi:excisionase family DNA binding protein